MLAGHGRERDQVDYFVPTDKVLLDRVGDFCFQTFGDGLIHFNPKENLCANCQLGAAHGASLRAK